VDIKLNFINNSNDLNNFQIVIFQKNVAGPNAPAVAWKVIQNCGQGSNHPFVFPAALSVNVIDGYGNHTAPQPAETGMMFMLKLGPSGHVLAPEGGAPDRDVHVANGLERGAITANLHKGGKLLASQPWVYPQQRTAFKFDPTLWIGAVSQMEEGAVMNQAILDSITTQLPVLGIVSADIVMSGGGPGAGATPLTFELANIIRG
jgi:hypothetical protein